MAYSILLNEMRKVPLTVAAPIIAEAENIIYADATRSLRDNTGILVSGLPYHEAESICGKLNDLGIGCFVMDESQFYIPPDARTLNAATLNEDGLFAMDYYQSASAYRWSDLLYIAVGRIHPRSKERYGTTTSLEYDHSDMYRYSTSMRGYGSVSVPKPQKKEPEMTKAQFFLDLFFRPPQEVHFRIVNDSFSYRYLGPRVAMSSAQNFRLVVDDVIRFAPHVFANPGMEAFLDRAPKEQMEYRDVQVFDRQNLWMLQIVYLNLQQE